MYAFRPVQSNLLVRRPAVHRQPKATAGQTPKPQKMPSSRPYSFAAHSASESNVGRHVPPVPALPPRPVAYTHAKPQATSSPVLTDSFSSKAYQRPAATTFESIQQGVDSMTKAIVSSNAARHLIKELTRLQDFCQSQIDTAPRSRGGFFSFLFRNRKRAHSVPTIPESKRLENMNRIVEISVMLKRLRLAELELGQAIASNSNQVTESRSADPYCAKLLKDAKFLLARVRVILQQEELARHL